MNILGSLGQVLVGILTEAASQLRRPTSQAYMDAMMALPAWQEWDAASRAEPWVIEKSEVA